MTTPTTFTRPFPVRSYEVRADGAVGHSAFLRWFQEAAFEASKAAGYGAADYAAMGVAWIMRGVDVEFLVPAHYGETVAVTTWVSDFRRVRSHREYEARRVADGRLLARARADWVFLDRAALRPRRVPPEMAARFVLRPEPVLAPLEWSSLDEGEPLGRFESRRLVRRYEMDEMAHVNNAIYLDWIEEQCHDAWTAWGAAPDMLRLRRHQIEYREGAVAGDELRLESHAARVGGATMWRHLLQRGGATLAEAHTLSE